jgi:hypothetical protein
MVATATLPNVASIQINDFDRRTAHQPETTTGRTGEQSEVAAVQAQSRRRSGFFATLLRSLSAWTV